VSISEQDWQAAVDALAEAEVAVISCHIHPTATPSGPPWPCTGPLPTPAGRRW
jgi:hypothetical protein